MEPRRAGRPARSCRACCRSSLVWIAAAALLIRAVTVDAQPAAAPQQFGNAEANLRFLDATGALTPDVDVLEIGTGTGGMLHALLDRGLSRPRRRAQPGADRRVAHAGSASCRFSRSPASRSPSPTPRSTSSSASTSSSTSATATRICARCVAGAAAGRPLSDSDAEQVAQRRVRNDPLEEPHALAGRSLLAAHAGSSCRRRLQRTASPREFFDVPVVNDFFRERCAGTSDGPARWRWRSSIPTACRWRGGRTCTCGRLKPETDADADPVTVIN